MPRDSKVPRVGFTKAMGQLSIEIEQLLALGMPEDRIYLKWAFSGTTRRNRSGLDRRARQQDRVSP